MGMYYFVQVLLICIFIHSTTQSAGDNSPFYQKCLEKCNILNCTDDGLNFLNNNKQSLILKITQWSCDDECRYDCMWQTVIAFHKRKWRVPQFHGKWPFIRILGLQEPASVAFSLLNLYLHIRMIRKFRKQVRPDSPLYFMWHFFCMVCINAWFWSSVFHARDFPFTELMDYSCAFSIVLVSCYCMVLRVLRNAPRTILVILTTFFLAVFLNHVAYLSTGRFSYSYNMQLNIAVGGFTGIGWFAWCAYNRKRQPYTWKCAAFVTLGALSALLEVIDQPPLFFMYDYHSLWHLSSAPLTLLFYNFIIDDCRYLKKQSLEKSVINKSA